MIVNMYSYVYNLLLVIASLIALFPQNNKFFKIGQLMGMSIAQEGSGFPFFSHTGYKYLCNEDVGSLDDITIEDVPSPDARNLLEKVRTYTLLKSLVATFTTILI